MYKGILHTHSLIVILYSIFFLIKLILLFADSKNKLDVFRNKTKVVEMILSTLFLATGIYLAVESPYWKQTWFLAKMALTIALIVAGVITFKKDSKILGVIVILLFGGIYYLSYEKPWSMHYFEADTSEEKKYFNLSSPGYNPVEHGSYLFNQFKCNDCHGKDGTRGLAGASDLTKSDTPEQELSDVIRNGKGNMPAYGQTLREDQIKALTAYVLSFRK